MIKKPFEFRPYIVAGIIAFVFGIVVFFTYFFIDGCGLNGACNAALFSGFILISIAGFMYVGRNGFFDIFSYGFKQASSMLFSKKPSEYNDFPGYKNSLNEMREIKPKNYFSFLIIGSVFLLISVILLITIKNL